MTAGQRALKNYMEKQSIKGDRPYEKSRSRSVRSRRRSKSKDGRSRQRSKSVKISRADNQRDRAVKKVYSTAYQIDRAKDRTKDTTKAKTSTNAYKTHDDHGTSSSPSRQFRVLSNSHSGYPSRTKMQEKYSFQGDINMWDESRHQEMEKVHH